MNTFIREFRTSGSFFGYREDVISAWFAICDELYMRNALIPSDWRYSPGAVDDPREDTYLADVAKDLKSKDLLAAGRIFSRYVNLLERKGVAK